MTQQIQLAWGARVSAEFRLRAIAVANGLKIAPNDLMACMAFETGETFSPSVKNGAGSGATGLIQFMPATARSLGTTVDALAGMSAVQQLDYVRVYFAPYRGKLKGLGDVYMAILWPAGIGKSDDAVLFDQADPARPKLYKQNAGLDYNRNGQVTRGEACAKVMEKLRKGLLPANVAAVELT